MKISIPTLAVVGLLLGGRRQWQDRRLQHLPSAAELLATPLPRLYRWAVWSEAELYHTKRQERHRLGCSAHTRAMRWWSYRWLPCSLARIRAELLSVRMMVFVRLIGWIPTRDYRGLRLQQMLGTAMRYIDDTVDGDRRPSVGSSVEYVAHVTRLLEGFDGDQLSHEPVLPEDLPLMYLMAATRRLTGIDPMPHLLLMWRLYLPDAQRVMAGEPLPSRAVQEQVMAAYVELGRFAALLVGLEADRVELHVEQDALSITAADMLNDLPADIARGQLGVPHEELKEHGIEWSQLSGCTSWEQLAEIPAVVEWYTMWARRAYEQWLLELYPLLEQEIAPHIRPGILLANLRVRWAQRGRSLEASANRFS